MFQHSGKHDLKILDGYPFCVAFLWRAIWGAPYLLDNDDDMSSKNVPYMDTVSWISRPSQQTFIVLPRSHNSLHVLSRLSYHLPRAQGIFKRKFSNGLDYDKSLLYSWAHARTPFSKIGEGGWKGEEKNTTLGGSIFVVWPASFIRSTLVFSLLGTSPSLFLSLRDSSPKYVGKTYASLGPTRLTW